MPSIEIIDLNFQETREAIASFVVETDAGPVLIETGPESTFPQLEAGLHSMGYSPKDVKHVLLTHIHFDHAGAAWKLADQGAKIYVHPDGKPHLVQPEKLWASAAKIYGVEMDRLWGKMEPISPEQVIAVQDSALIEIGNQYFKAIYTPGHAVHHVAWKLGSSIFTGDVAGVKIGKGPVVPPCPPPDIHLEHWLESIAKIKIENADKLYLTHYGSISDVDQHMDRLEKILRDWSEWMKIRFDAGKDQTAVIPEFMAYTEKQLLDEGCPLPLLKVYEYANPSWMSVAGLYRYWKLKDQGRI